jgi:hypothetical protein
MAAVNSKKRKTTPVKPYRKTRLFNYRFDFEVGFLAKSPCRECENRKDFPKCADTCATLDRIHEVLSHTVSCAKAF